MKLKYDYRLAHREWAWSMDPADPMGILIYHHGHQVMSIFLGEAMEVAGRELVMKHVAECDRTPWLTKWRAQRDAEMMDLLSKKYGYDQ
jgi:hypothetical protein